MPKSSKGGNQYQPDPRQALFLSFYLDPKKKKTFGNALQSALEAGYSKEYAEVIIGQMPEWLSVNLSKQNIVAIAEKNLIEHLEMDTHMDVVVGRGDAKIVVKVRDPQFERIKAEQTRFALERLNKGEYSSRVESTGAGGKDLFGKIKNDPTAVATLVKAAKILADRS